MFITVHIIVALNEIKRNIEHGIQGQSILICLLSFVAYLVSIGEFCGGFVVSFVGVVVQWLDYLAVTQEPGVRFLGHCREVPSHVALP